MNITNRFYVYGLSRPNGIPIYIGYGQNRRIIYHKQVAKKYKHQNEDLQLEFEIAWDNGEEIIETILVKDLSLEEARFLEIQLIAKIGRRDLGLGTLCNKTNGGEGTNPSKETIQKIRLKHLGVKRSETTKMRISDALRDVKHPPERVLANSLSHRGEKHYMFGKHHLESTKQILSKQRSGPNHYFYGKKWSPEQRERTMEGRRKALEEKSKNNPIDPT